MPLTVLQVLPELESGGVERGTLEVARELARRGHRSLVASAGGRMVATLEAEGSQHFTCPIGVKSPLTLFKVGWLRRLILERRVDILHVRSRVPAWVAWLAWKSLPLDRRPRFVTTVHGLYSPGRYSAIMTRGEAVIAVSRTIREYITANYPRTPTERIHLIYRGVDPNEFPHGFRPSTEWLTAFYQQFPQCVGKQLITLPGRITRLKGHEAMLRLLARMKESQANPAQPQFHGLIVGGEDPKKKHYADELRRMILQSGLQDVVTMTGHRSDMKEIYAISSVVLSLSSKPESFGRTVLEALQLGTPVAGFAHGGVGEILGDVFPSGTVAQGNEEQLFAQVSRLLANPQRVPSTECYRLSEMLDRTIHLYEQLAAGTADSSSRADSHRAA